MIPYAADQSINIDSCGETQGCLIVPEQCNSDAKCEYTLSWQVLDDAKVKFHIIARAQGFVGIGFSADEKRVRANRRTVLDDDALGSARSTSPVTGCFRATIKS